MSEIEAHQTEAPPPEGDAAEAGEPGPSRRPAVWMLAAIVVGAVTGFLLQARFESANRTEGGELPGLAEMVQLAAVIGGAGLFGLLLLIPRTSRFVGWLLLAFAASAFVGTRLA